MQLLSTVPNYFGLNGVEDREASDVIPQRLDGHRFWRLNCTWHGSLPSARLVATSKPAQGTDFWFCFTSHPHPTLIPSACYYSPHFTSQFFPIHTTTTYFITTVSLTEYCGWVMGSAAY